MFMMLNVPGEELELRELRLSSFEVESNTSKFDLTMAVSEADAIHMVMEYNTDLFDASTIKRMLQHYECLVESIVADPSLPINDLSILTEAELNQLLIEWNDNHAEFPTDLCFHQLFEAQTERTPDFIAVECEGEQLTYDQLNRNANRLARLLVNQGIICESVVALLSNRNIDMLVSILAIFKAGGAYLPLDPNHPIDRLTQALGQSDARLVLVAEEFIPTILEALEGIASPLRPSILVIDELPEDSTEEVNLTSRSSPRSLAYIIYTSGSTGRPKGAMIEQRGMVNHLSAKVKGLGLTSADRVAENASQSFDVSMWQFLSPLLVGGRTVIFTDEVAHDALRLLVEVEDKAVSVIETVPSLLRIMLEAADQVSSDKPALSSLRWMLSNGEPLTIDLCHQWFNAYPNVPLINAYGPTECSDDVTHYFIHHSPSEAVIYMALGRPLENMQLYILDARGLPVPIGVRGEIYVGGIGVSRGYINDASRTGEVFLPDPFGEEAGARLYKTGDLGRYLNDGNIDFLGRIDHQVKVRGFRIELGEIEVALSQYPKVKDVVVASRDDKPGNKRIIAYVVPASGDLITINEMQRHLKQRLPDYMIPSAFIIMESLPLSSNGKVDRKALPALNQFRPEMESKFTPPRDLIEEIVADIWADVLGLERVGVYDNFFDLGGHSLLATQVISRIREALNVEIQVRRIFEMPTVAELAGSIESSMKSNQAVSIPAITPASALGPLPLSFAQQRLWFLDQLEPGNSGYNISDPIRLLGPLNISALARTRDEIVRRHESLRTTFSMINGQPVQIINPAVSAPLPIIDLTELDHTQALAEAHILATSEANEPFDLERGPLLRVSLIKLRDEDHVVLFTMHHIISDGWSMGVLVEEVAQLYEAYSQGDDSPLEELAIQYADYAVWQREWLKGEVLEEEIRYWKEQLAGAPAVIELPTDRARPAMHSYRGARERWEIGAEVADKMRELSKEEGVTMFMSMLGAFKVLMSRYSGQQDIVVGTPIANRRRVELEKLIGFFANTLVMRSKVEREESFKEMMKKVRVMALEGYAHQDVPFEMLVEKLEPERAMSHTPMFQVMFMMLNVPGEELELRELRLSSFEVESNTSKFDLTMAMAGTPAGLNIMVEYSTDLFDKATIHRMLTHFETLIERIAEEPNRKISELSLLKESERQQLLVDWNQTKCEYGEPKCIHQWFEQQAEERPAAVAVAYEDEMLSYGELNRRSNQLAHYLMKKGVKVEDFVAICVERSIEMVVGVLGVLKAGAAYVPLDPTYPAERLAYMIADSRAKVLLTQAGIREELHNESVEVVYLDSDCDHIADCSVNNPVNQVSPDNLLYVIYTSGSTGRPKGIGLSHCALAGLIEWHFTTLSQGAKTLQYASLSFDASFHEIFSAWCGGGTLYIVPEYLRADIAKLGQYINRAGIEKAILPVVALQQLAELNRAKAGELAGLKEIIATGEQLQITSPIKELFTQLKDTTLDNHYGPSETHVVTWKRLDERVDRWAAHVPIGKPISNTQAYVLDSQMQPVPVGVLGELYISGAGLARGYMNQASLTAEKFIPAPYSPQPGQRLYKTGDLARYLPEGDIEFAGRKDHQVKVRGYRVELAEIEAVLGEHDAVEEVIVTATQGGSADKRLIAYVVLQEGWKNQEDELQRYASTRMPDYMVPSVIVKLERMPVTANGKVDRRALPVPDLGIRSIKQEVILPRTQAEQVLAGIWADVLGVQEVGIYDNFFRLGGHSILAALAIFRIREAFHLDLPLRSLFEYPTIDGLINLLVGICGSPDIVEQIAQTFLDLQQLSQDEIKALLDKIESE
jgi:amino acid adenylation domain-containing protein